MALIFDLSRIRCMVSDALFETEQPF